MRVILFTATGAENLGDELITLCEIRELQKKEENIQITLFSHSIESTKRFLSSQKCSLEHVNIREYFPNNIRRHPLRNIKLLWETIREIRISDNIYIGGGGLLYSRDEEWHSPLLLWSLRTMICKLFWKKIIYLSLWVTAKKEEISPLSSLLFKNTKISVRDTESLSRIQSLWYNGDILPDPVWNLEVKKENNTEKMIGIALRSGFLPDKILSETIKKLQEQWYEIVLLPHSLHPSDEVSHDGYYLQNFLFPGVRTSQTIEQTLEYYKRCHIILGMRFHSMILASIYGIPFIGISYGEKTSSLLSEIGWKYSLTGDRASTDTLVEAVRDMESRFPEISNQLQKISIQMKEKYIQWFQTLLWK